MLIRIFAVLMLLNLAGQAVQANAEDFSARTDADMFSWQTGYATSLTQGVAGEKQSSETGECVRRAVMMVVNQLLFDRKEADTQQFNGRTAGYGIGPAQYAMDVDHDEVSLTVGWTF
ncbi:hypothetical protein [Hahella ganghwensis]|uniref:hypothetical protein n=1 Tax=Hahella ganghwensis TaxID=286420 RepID=UPI00037F3566|nr:hypothetical protein [Hahella ganghwensis]